MQHTNKSIFFSHRLVIGLAALLLLTPAMAKKLYRWVDENGKVHYSDQIPPDQVKVAHEKLNAHGVVVDKVPRAKTPEEIKAERKRKKEEEKARQAAEEKRKQREKILKIYGSEAEILRLRDERKAALERNIETARANLSLQQRNLQDLLKRAADRERSGKKVSEAFLSQIETVREQIAYQNNYIKNKQKEKGELMKRFDRELALYRQIMQERRGSHAGKGTK
jgi:hypothetical protein